MARRHEELECRLDPTPASKRGGSSQRGGSAGPLTQSQSVKKSYISQLKNIPDLSSSAIAGVRPCTRQKASQGCLPDNMKIKTVLT